MIAQENGEKNAYFYIKQKIKIVCDICGDDLKVRVDDQEFLNIKPCQTCINEIVEDSEK